MKIIKPGVVNGEVHLRNIKDGTMFGYGNGTVTPYMKARQASMSGQPVRMVDLEQGIEGDRLLPNYYELPHATLILDYKEEVKS